MNRLNAITMTKCDEQAMVLTGIIDHLTSLCRSLRRADRLTSLVGRRDEAKLLGDGHRNRDKDRENQKWQQKYTDREHFARLADTLLLAIRRMVARG